MLSALPSRVLGQDNATGKVSENLYEISKPHMKDPFRWPSIWSLTPQAGNNGGMQSWRSARDNSGDSEDKNGEDSPSKPKNDWKASEERRTRAYIKKMAPLMPSSAISQVPLEANPKTAPDGPVRHYLSQAVILTTPFLAEPGSGGFFPGECKLRYSGSNESEILQLFDEVVLSVGQASGVKPGDLYRTYQVGDQYRSYASGRGIGRLVETSGMVEVTRVGAKTSIARLVRCFGTIAKDSRACPYVPAAEVTATTYNPSTDNKLAAQVVWVTSQQQFPQPYSYAIVDRGTVKGYRIGDMVLFFNRNEGRMTDKVLGNGIVVSVGDKSATILIRDLFPGIINRGDYTVVIQSAVL
ncbi:MAG: LysM protein [Fibrobacteres bacterium]|nr:LysM protein [Fibrobacterota bacterium]